MKQDQEFKYCPRCGSPNFIQKSKKEYLCENCKFNFFTNSSAAVAAIIKDKEGRIMLTKRAFNPWKGKLDFPGGFVDPDESAETALKREIKEELGVEIVSYKYLCSFPNVYPFSGINVKTTDLGYLVEVEGIEKIHPEDDVAGIVWKKPKEINDDEIPFNSTKNFVKKLIEMVDE